MINVHISCSLRETGSSKSDGAVTSKNKSTKQQFQDVFKSFDPSKILYVFGKGSLKFHI